MPIDQLVGGREEGGCGEVEGWLVLREELVVVVL